MPPPHHNKKPAPQLAAAANHACLRQLVLSAGWLAGQQERDPNSQQAGPQTASSCTTPCRQRHETVQVITHVRILHVRVETGGKSHAHNDYSMARTVCKPAQRATPGDLVKWNALRSPAIAVNAIPSEKTALELRSSCPLPIVCVPVILQQVRSICCLALGRQEWPSSSFFV